MNIILVFFLVLSSSFAANKPQIKKSTPVQKEKSSTSSGSKSIWKQWFKYSVNSEPLGYYFEEVDKQNKQNEITISQHWWEKDPQAGVAETFIGSVAKDLPGYPPVAFFVERKSAILAKNFDARSKNDKLVIQIKDFISKKDKKIFISLNKTEIFSSFLSLYIAQKGKSFEKKAFGFKTILEDSKDESFEPSDGQARITQETEKINNETCFKVEFVFMNTPSIWWVEKNGRLCKQYIPSYNSILVATTEEDAKKSLK